jgi:hypothetical protein
LNEKLQKQWLDLTKDSAEVSTELENQKQENAHKTEITKNIEDLEVDRRQLQDTANAIGKEIEQCSNNIGGLAATA